VEVIRNKIFHEQQAKYFEEEEVFPSPDYWRNSRTDDLIHWNTSVNFSSINGKYVEEFFGEENLNKITSGHKNVIISSNTLE
jgi:hypothetical protein